MAAKSGGASGQKSGGPNKDRKGGLGGTGGNAGGGAQYGADGADAAGGGRPNAVDRAMADRRADAEAEKAKADVGHSGSKSQGPSGLPSTRPGAVPPGSLPPGVNPLKYQNKPTQSFAPTASNLGSVAAQVVGTLAAPGLSMAVPGIKALTDDEFDPLNPYEQPEGMVGGAATPETSENVGKAASGELPESAYAPPPPKKKKAAVPTLSSIGTLLDGAGGTLVAS